MPIGTFARPNVHFMNHFFRSFFAALLALFVFSVITFVGMLVFLAVVSASQKVETGKNAVLLVDLSNHYSEIEPADPLSKLTGDANGTPPSLYHLTRLIRHAADDESVEGIFLKCEHNANDFASSEAIRKALADFRESGKFIIASGNSISQTGYYVASIADRVYCSPIGGVDWNGFSVTMPFLKGTFDKLGIEPQVFYAGKYKSATEHFRLTQMTEENRVQTLELLSDVYSNFLKAIADSRKLDSSQLRKYADSLTVRYAGDAVKAGMIDGAKYDDEIKDEIRDRLKIDKDDRINFLTPAKYAQAVKFLPERGSRIAVIYAEGNIIDGHAERGQIGGDTYRNMIRKARMDESVKAVVLRVNSGGGSVMASEVIWREVILTKKVKPIIISLGDVAASGGYYIACGADSIFAEPNTITGSIGVFGLVPNMQNFFNDKLGVTFDEVKTSPNAGPLTITKPLSASQRLIFQQQIDTAYHDFKTRVSQGRKKSMEYVDSVAQGRIWSGTRALQLGLVDRLGGLDEAIDAAAAKANLKEYRLREYPDEPGFLEFIKGKSESSRETNIRKELGEDVYKTFNSLRQIKSIMGNAQARMPFELIIE